jgi:hypothetical protein
MYKYSKLLFKFWQKSKMIHYCDTICNDIIYVRANLNCKIWNELGFVNLI